jgi:hypothetical protein
MPSDSSNLRSGRAFFRTGIAPGLLHPLAALCLALLVPIAPNADEEGWDASVPAAPDSASVTSRPASAPASQPVSAALFRKVQALKEQANKHYRAKRYSEACRIYGEAALLDANDAGVRNDLGICYQNLGRKDSALDATREALRLADRSLAASSEPDWSFPDLRARKTAYFNLDKIGGSMREPRAGQCVTWSAFSSCNGRYHVCVAEGSRPAEGGSLRWQTLRVALTRSRALFSYDEVEVPSQVPKPEMRDMEELSIEGVPESKLRWVNRDSSVAIPLGDILETADSACAGRCGNLERVQSECRVIHFDPCAGVVGVACGIQEGAGKDRIVIGEFYLVPQK